MTRANDPAAIAALSDDEITAAALRIERRIEVHIREAAERRAVALASKPRKGIPRSPECRAKQRAATFAAFAATVPEDAPLLRRLRIERGWTLPELAARAGCSRTAAWDAENRSDRTRETTWRKLSFGLFGTTTEWRTLRDGDVQGARLRG